MAKNLAIVTGAGSLAAKILAAAGDLSEEHVHYTIKPPLRVLPEFARLVSEAFRRSSGAIGINPFSFADVERELVTRGIKRIFFACDFPSVGSTHRFNTLEWFSRVADEKCAHYIKDTPTNLLVMMRYFLALNALLHDLDVEPLLACQIFPQFNLQAGNASVREPPKEVMDRLPDVIATLTRQWGLLRSERSRSTQSVIVDRGIIVECESGELIGTDNILRRYGARYSLTRDAPYLLKPPSVEFNPAVDQPTIGVETVELCRSARVQGIIICAETTTVIDKAETIKRINDYGMFLYALPFNLLREIYVRHSPETWVQHATIVPSPH